MADQLIAKEEVAAALAPARAAAKKAKKQRQKARKQQDQRSSEDKDAAPPQPETEQTRSCAVSDSTGQSIAPASTPSPLDGPYAEAGSVPPVQSADLTDDALADTTADLQLDSTASSAPLSPLAALFYCPLTKVGAVLGL